MRPAGIAAETGSTRSTSILSPADLPNLLGSPLGNPSFPPRVCKLFSRGPPRQLPPWAPSLVHLVLAPPPIVGAVVPAELLAHSEVA